MISVMKKICCILFLSVLLCLLSACLPASAEDSGLPSLCLTVDPEAFRLVLESPDHSYRAEGGSLSLRVPEDWRGEFGGAESLESLPLAYLRGRGNSTWLNRKKPFKLKLESGADLLGMSSGKHWVLLADAIDGSLLRNRLMSYAGRALGLPYTPKMVPVELYVNDEYQGCYVLSQQIRKGKNRVHIGDDDFLLSMSPDEDEAQENIVSTSRGIRFLCEDPVFASDDPSDPVADAKQKENLESFLQQVEDAVYAEVPENASGLPCAGLMDLSSAARYWWIEEFFMNGDGAFTPSTYLYTTGNSLCWGPLWDFDLSIPSSSPAEGFNTVRMPWLDHLRAFSPAYREILKEEWSVLCPILTDMARDGGVIDRWTEEIRPAWERNAAAGFAEESLEQDDLADQAARIRNWFRQRIDWISSHLETDLAEAWVEVYFYADGEYLSTAQIPLPDGRLSESDLPEAPLREGSRFAGWTAEDGTLYGPGDLPDTDLELFASYVPAE